MNEQPAKDEPTTGQDTATTLTDKDKVDLNEESEPRTTVEIAEKTEKEAAATLFGGESPAKPAELTNFNGSRASSPSHFEDNEDEDAQKLAEEAQKHSQSPKSDKKGSEYESEKKYAGELRPVDDQEDEETPQKEANNTESQEKELTDILVDAAFKKQCSEHKQMIVTICTDFSCPKRFWCGICCVKSKDLYVRYSTHMTLISDFLEENISKLYKVKTFTDVDKKSVDTQLKNIMAKNEANFEETWKLIDHDIEAYKAEVVSKIDGLKASVKERFNRSVKNINVFYDELSDTISTSKTRDMSLELEELKSQVSNGTKDALEAIESIGNKVNVDIYDVETLNSEFDKSRDFIKFIHSHYDSVKDTTIPLYVSMERSISALAEKVESLSQPKIKALLDDSHKDLTEFRLYYESMIANDVPKSDHDELLNEYLQRRQEPDYHRESMPRDVEESMQGKQRQSRPDKKMQNTMRDADRKGLASGRERAVDHSSSLREQRVHMQPQKSTPGKISNNLSFSWQQITECILLVSVKSTGQ